VHHLLSRVCGLKVWYDERDMEGGGSFGCRLPEVIGDCQSLMVLVSRAAAESGWVREECSAAREYCVHHPDFRIIPIPDR